MIKLHLQTSRCSLRHLSESDLYEAVELFTDSRVRAYLGGPISEQQAFVKLQSWISSTDSLYVAIRAVTTNEFIGIISVCPHHENEYMELSYQLLPKFWDQGIAAEAIRTILIHLKESSSINMLVAETQKKNERSCKLLKKLGFKPQQTIMRFGEEQIIFKICL